MRDWFRKGNNLIRDLLEINPPENCAAIWHIGQCGIFLKYQGKVLLVDPVLTPIFDENGKSCKHFDAPFDPQAPFPADAVFCTHNHLDHLNAETIRGIAASHPETRFYVPQGVMPEISALIEPFCERVTGLRQDETCVLFPGLSVTAIAAAHDRYKTDENGNEKALGYLFHCGELNLFHAGDTLATDRLVREVSAHGNIHAAFLPINGRDWVRESNNIIGNMTPQEAALFADLISCDTVFPVHYDMMTGNEENPLIFAQYMADRYPLRPYHFLQLGEPFLFWR